jgi:hypothetical protein
MKKTKQERQQEILPVIESLNKMHIKPALNESVKNLYKKLQEFINDGETMEIEIPIEEMNLRVYGVLEKNINKRTWLKMGALAKMED